MTPPRHSCWLMQGAALAASFAMVGLAVAEPQTQQAGSDRQPTIKELMRRLEERDALIVDLQRRVGELAAKRHTGRSRAARHTTTGGCQARALGATGSLHRPSRSHRHRPKRLQGLKAAQRRQRPANSRSMRRRPSARWTGHWW